MNNEHLESNHFLPVTACIQRTLSSHHDTEAGIPSFHTFHHSFHHFFYHEKNDEALL
jgi:hypothetical protein